MPLIGEDESVGERAANHTWSFMSAIGGAVIVTLIGSILTCGNGELKFAFATPWEERFFECSASFPGVLDNPFLPFVVAAIVAVLVYSAVELFTAAQRRRSP